jgi:hypothetical protein
MQKGFCFDNLARSDSNRIEILSTAAAPQASVTPVSNSPAQTAEMMVCRMMGILAWKICRQNGESFGASQT